jgi:hypothetical protein
MKKLPAELVTHIVSFLPTQKTTPGSYKSIEHIVPLAPHATISKSWNATVEAVLWRSLNVADTDWADFVARMGNESGQQRKRLLTKLTYTVTWSAEKEEGENRHDRLFSMRMARLYDLLADWGSGGDMTLSKLHLHILHPEIEDYLKNRGNLAYLYLNRSLFGTRRPLSYIAEFFLFAEQARLWPGDIEALVAPFEGIETLCMVLHDWERKDRDMRRKARIGRH